MKEKKVKRFLAITMFVLLAFIFCSGTFVVKSSAVTAPLEMNNMSMQKNAIIANDSNEANDSLTKMNKKDSLRNKLIEDVNIHIRRNFRIHDSNLPMYLVEYSLKYIKSVGCFIKLSPIVSFKRLVNPGLHFNNHLLCVIPLVLLLNLLGYI